MSAKILATLLLFSSLAFAGGYWAALRNGAAGKVTPPSSTEATPTNAHVVAAWPAIRSSRTAPETTANNRDRTSAKPTLEELEAKIRELNTGGFGFGNRHAYADWQKLMDAMDPADFAPALALVEKSGARNPRDSLRGMLLAKWAQTDPAAALASANTVSNKSSREMAIMSVVNGWAEKDAVAATAWAQQLPPGQLRNQALGAVTGELAAVDPAAAFDLMKSTGANNAWRWGGLHQIFSSWVEKDPAAASMIPRP